MDLLSGRDSPGWLSHACHGGGGCLWAPKVTTGEPDGSTAGLGLRVLIGLSSSLSSETTGAGSTKYSIDEYCQVWLVGHMIGISGMAVVNEDGMTGVDGWTGWVAGRVMVMEGGVADG